MIYIIYVKVRNINDESYHSLSTIVFFFTKKTFTKNIIIIKTLKSFVIVLLGILMTANFAFAQNYKTPKINASGKVIDVNGTHLGG
jgi:hypothetical protein